MLNGNFADRAKRNAPPEAVNTEAFSADLIPVPAVMEIAKAKSVQPANFAAKRVPYPSNSATTSADSTALTNQASVGITAARNQDHAAQGL